MLVPIKKLLLTTFYYTAQRYFLASGYTIISRSSKNDFFIFL